MGTRRVVVLVAVVVLAGCAGFQAGGSDPAGPAATPTDAGSAATTGASAGTTATATTTTPTGTASATTTAPPGLTVTVEAVASADTLVVRHPNRSLDRVRLRGVDAPPVHWPADPTKYEGVPHNRASERCLGEVAQSAHETMAARLEGATVRIVPPDSTPPRDAAGRLLGHLVHDGQRLDRLLVRDGFAHVTDGDHSERADLLALQATARADGTGVWRCAEIDWQFGDNTTLSIERVHADAGDGAPDYRHLNDEYVVITNTGGKSVELTGWSVYDADDDLDYDFPDRYVLGPGQSVVLHTGDGIDRRGNLYWSLNREAWDNDGDVVYLRRPGGSVALRYQYGNVTGL